MAVIQLLLDAGADPNVKADDGKTPLDLAKGRGPRANIELLQEVTY